MSSASPATNVLRRMIEPQIAAGGADPPADRPSRRACSRSSPIETTSGSWSRPRRVVAKAEQLDGKENPRFVVTSLNAEEWPAQRLYEELYCERGEMENRIKEQLSLFAYRVSAETMRANQLRVYFAAMAYVLTARTAAVGTERDGVGTGAGDDDPAAAAEDRRADPDQCAEGVAVDGVELSVAAAVRTGAPEPAARGCAGRMTRNRRPQLK